ncbi:hypothetical protein DBR32_11255 [Taibaiella sp. KBW10]|uniref:hypothetical protein n=1 Tax=Taibaiella sp. KBW10 TaxID=2153357 RepID=UPI000F59F411|nr:hypothetical protein [Taibaiella sp. KBW10]RQO30155.1 hypothetical protein DBR32_11255 [Taibaiella sp. KBW10]
MKPVRFFLLAALLFSKSLSYAQISAFINGKPVKAGATISKNDLASLEVSFKNPKNPSFIYGRTVLVVDLLNAKNSGEGYWYLRKDGSAAVEDFLKHTPATKKFKVFEKGVMEAGGNNLDWIYKFASGKEECKTLQVKISLNYREKTGYEEYAQAINLLEPLVFNVTIWDNKNLFLPYLDLSVDKSNIASDFSLNQSGPLTSSSTIWGYELKDKNNYHYSIYAISSDKFPGMNTKELADDFIHAAAYYASQDFVTKFSNYDIEKYTIDWNTINGLLTERRRIPSLSWKNNREIKKMDLMTLYQPVDINGLKGYTFSASEESRTDRSSKWQENGKFVIYIFDHPSNPNLTLVASTSVYNDATNTDEMDAFLKSIIKSIKH